MAPTTTTTTTTPSSPRSTASSLTPSTISTQESAIISHHLTHIRKEDVLSSLLTPLEWSESTLSPARSAFLTRVDSLTPMQKSMHFRYETFELVCTGGKPTSSDNDGGYFRGELEFMECIRSWTTRTIVEGKRYIKTLNTRQKNLSACGILEVERSSVASNLFLVSVLFFGVEAGERLAILDSLFVRLSFIDDVRVPERRLGCFLVNDGKREGKRGVVACESSLIPLYDIGSAMNGNRTGERMRRDYMYHESWELVSHPMLLPLLIRRRRQIGNFWLMNASENYALFAKFVTVRGGGVDDYVGKGGSLGEGQMDDVGYHMVEGTNNNMYLVQYEINVRSDHVLVNFYMDTPRGVFHPLLVRHRSTDLFLNSMSSGSLRDIKRDDDNDVMAIYQNNELFNKIHKRIKRRDQECGRALRSRSRLLSVFSSKRDDDDSFLQQHHHYHHQQQRETNDQSSSSSVDQANDVERLLDYSSQLSMELRFFHENSGTANDMLAELTSDFILSGSFECGIAKLTIDRTMSIGDHQPGLWFLIRHETNTLSIAHLSLINNALDPLADDTDIYRKLTFFTFGISDLYCMKQDYGGDDDDSDGDSDGENQQLRYVSEIANMIDTGHGRNYARAAYLALRRNNGRKEDTTAKMLQFNPNDLGYALNFCNFTDVADEFVSKSLMTPSNEALVDGGDRRSDGETVKMCFTSLPDVITSIFKPVPGSSGKYFFFAGAEDDDAQFEDHINELLRRQALRREMIIIKSDDDENNEDDERSHSSSDDADVYDDETPIMHGGALYPLEYGSDIEVTLDDVVAPPHSAIIATEPSEDFSSSGANANELLSMTLPPVDPPLFAKFEIDDQVASIDDLTLIARGSHITASVSLFSDASTYVDEGDLPSVHSAAAHALRLKLGAYVASQTLERLRHFETSLSEADLKIAMKCLIESDNVASTTIPVHFFDSQSDSLVLASLTALDDNESSSFSSKGFENLSKELIGFMKVRRAGSGDAYYVTGMEFWSFVQVDPKRGILIHAYHPCGAEKAKEVSLEILVSVRKTCHRVNQLLLLESLHESRQASQYLIPVDHDLFKRSHENAIDTSLSSRIIPPKDNDDGGNSSSNVKSPPSSSSGEFTIIGSFACPEKFQTSFLLNHRVSVSQAIITLESSILHPFALSNRRGIFVYKDETENIFYMMIRQRENGSSENYDEVELVVYGVGQPGPSITVQLCRLLEKKILSLSVETLSSVLNKNPYFTLLHTDVEFLQSFEDKWHYLSLEGSNSTPVRNNIDSGSRHSEEYDIPTSCYDPIKFMLYFRQNMCGSTYFHRLQEAVPLADGSVDGVYPDKFVPPSEVNKTVLERGLELRFDASSFVLFYNNAPSALNPNFQPVSTLTTKGAHYGRETGNGIALLYFSLLTNNGSPIVALNLGATPREEKSRLNVALDSLRLRKCNKNSNDNPDEKSTNFRLRVDIVNTTLNISALYSWIELTLNQAFVGWVVEHHLQRARLGLLLPCDDVDKNQEGFSLTFHHAAASLPKETPTTVSCLDSWCLRHVDKICPGLPALWSILKSSYDLPHLAVERIDSSHRIKSSSVAKLTLDLLEHAVLAPLFGVPMRVSESGCEIVRCLKSKGHQRQRGRKRPHSVNLFRTVAGEPRVETRSKKGEASVIKDGPTDSPEYICAFGFGKDDAKYSKSTLLFREAMVSDHESDDKNAFTQGLIWLKNHKREAFDRSLAFILSVGRTSRSLFLYNAHPHIVEWIKNSFREVETELVREEGRKTSHQQMRCRICNFVPTSIRGEKPTTKEVMSPPENAKPPSALTARSAKTTIEEEQQQRDASSRGGLKSKRKVHFDTTQKQRKRGDDVGMKRERKKMPVIIRQPRLIGQSMEGAAEQAKMLARARASTRSIMTTNGSIITERGSHRRGTRDRTNSGDGKRGSSFFYGGGSHPSHSVSDDTSESSSLYYTSTMSSSRRSFDDLSENSSSIRRARLSNTKHRSSNEVLDKLDKCESGGAVINSPKRKTEQGNHQTFFSKYLASASSIGRLPVNHFQSFIHELLLRIEEQKYITPSLLELINYVAFSVKIFSCELLPFAVTNVKEGGDVTAFLNYYTNIIARSINAKVIPLKKTSDATTAEVCLPLDETKQFRKERYLSPSSSNNTMKSNYLVRTIKCTRSCRLLVLIHVSVLQITKWNNKTARCRVWFVLEQHGGVSGSSGTDGLKIQNMGGSSLWQHNKRKKKSMFKLEKDSAKIDDIIGDICSKFQLQSANLNFGALSLMNYTKKRKDSIECSHLTNLIEMISLRFPSKLQERMLGLGQRIYLKRFLPSRWHRNSFSILYGDGNLLKYFDTCKSFSIIKENNDDDENICMVGLIKEDGIRANIFLIRSIEDNSHYDLYILCHATEKELRAGTEDIVDSQSTFSKLQLEKVKDVASGLVRPLFETLPHRFYQAKSKAKT